MICPEFRLRKGRPELEALKTSPPFPDDPRPLTGWSFVALVSGMTAR